MWVGIIKLIILLMTILFSYGKWRFSEETLREKKNEEFDKALAKNDTESLSGDLSDNFDELRKKNRDRSR